MYRVQALDNTKRVEILTNNAEKVIGIYLTGSSMYGFNLRVQGFDKKGTGLLLNRGSKARILAKGSILQSWFYFLNNGIVSQNGSSVNLSGPIQGRLNNIGLEVLSGADIKYANDVVINSNTDEDTKEPSSPDNILKAYH